MQDQVWFITGCSTGFGRELATAVLSQGGRVIVTARDRGKIADIAAEGGDRALALSLDVTDASQIAAAVRDAHARWDRIDVLVNNAGYGYLGTCEEGEDAAIRAQFDANVFGLFAMTRAVLPGMRARRSGHIINITSVAGLLGFPGSGYYAASKHAVEGFSDSLLAEVGPLGIRVTCVEPGPFRTDWAGRSLNVAANSIADYAEVAAAEGHVGKERHATGRSRARGASDDPHRADGRAAAPPGAGRARLRERQQAPPRSHCGNRGGTQHGAERGLPAVLGQIRGGARRPGDVDHLQLGELGETVVAQFAANAG